MDKRLLDSVPGAVSSTGPWHEAGRSSDLWQLSDEAGSLLPVQLRAPVQVSRD